MKMINQVLICLFVVLIFISCDKDNDNNCDPESVTSKWVLGKEIDVNYDTTLERNIYTIIDGEDRLFEYNHSGYQCDNIDDDEWGERLIFTINGGTTDFKFIDQDIIETNCYYQEYGAWVSSKQYQIKEGIINIDKISKKEWEVNVAVTTTPLSDGEQPKTIEFTEIFRE